MTFLKNIESIIEDFNSRMYICDEDGYEPDNAMAVSTNLVKHLVEVYKQTMKQKIGEDNE